MNVELVIKTVFEKLAKHKLLVVDPLVEQSITKSITKKVRKVGNMCRGTTARGTACSRKAPAGCKFCFQHGPPVIEDEPHVASSDEMSELEDDALASESEAEVAPRVPEKRHKKKQREHRKHKKAKKAKRSREITVVDCDYTPDVYSSEVVQSIKSLLASWCYVKESNGSPGVFEAHTEVFEKCDKVLDYIKRKKKIKYSMFDDLFHYLVNDYSAMENSYKYTAEDISKIPEEIEDRKVRLQKYVTSNKQ
ncbi:hypothetical protein BC941DRAFT_476717 [Chlamydoabsidia padenii]|nr:hypothetical protein BC941DRAFT_476717 [Chlamydoabsidia padenii]